MRLILLGPNGAGKGTQAIRLADRFGVAHVATGDLLRFAVKWKTEIGLRAKEYMDRGDLVPDEVVLELLRTKLERPESQNGFVLDGFPRNTAQAKSLHETLEAIGQRIDAVVSLEVPKEVLIERLSSRASCPTCGATYSLVEAEPIICPKDSTELFRRKDDKPEVIEKRLEVFFAETAPLIRHYETQGCLVHVDGVGDVNDVEKRIIQALESKDFPVSR